MNNKEITTFGGGCFWCIEAIIQQLKGVQTVVSGYSGGTTSWHPTYREVSSGLTGHAEVVQVVFVPEVLSFHDLLTIFMTSHDPTKLDRQTKGWGSQYRSIIFYHTEAQMRTAQKVFDELKGCFPSQIVTQLLKAEEFYEAAPNHQDYYLNNPGGGYCTGVIDPKISQLRKTYADKLKT